MEFVFTPADGHTQPCAAILYRAFITDAVVLYVMTCKYSAYSQFIPILSWIIDFCMEPIAITAGIIPASIINKDVVVPHWAALCLHIKGRCPRQAPRTQNAPSRHARQIVDVIHDPFKGAVL